MVRRRRKKRKKKNEEELVQCLIGLAEACAHWRYATACVLRRAPSKHPTALRLSSLGRPLTSLQSLRQRLCVLRLEFEDLAHVQLVPVELLPGIHILKHTRHSTLGILASGPSQVPIIGILVAKRLGTTRYQDLW